MKDMEKKTGRRIYSINKLAYLLSQGVGIGLKVETDINGHKKVYGVCYEDVSNIIDKYYKDEQLHLFLTCFDVVRKKLKEEI